MSKKKPKKFKKAFRNAAPVARAPRSAAAKPEEETPLRRLGMTAAGAAGTALIGSFLSHEGWAPKTIATALGAVGAGLAWKGDAANIRSLGAGAMSAAGSQLALMMIDDRDHAKSAPAAQAQAQVAQAQAAAQKRQASAHELPAGSLENAFERAKARLAISGGEQEEYAA
jgi:hypothetical protein